MADPSQQARDVLPDGTLVANRFRITGLLGVGGMATVYRADDSVLGRAVALKLLRKDLCATPEAQLRFRREGEVLSQLKHPAIVKIEAYGEVGDGSLFLAMEYLTGETLGQLLRREHAIEPRELAPLLAGAGAGLIAAHDKGIIHRDLKPDNIFLSRTTESSEVSVKLLDFGISKVFGSERLTMTGQVLGTPRYMAPEQLAAETNLDKRVDIYALGVILYEAIAGRSPFPATNASDLLVAILHGEAVPLRSARKSVPEPVAAVVMRAISRLPDARFQKVADLVDAYIGVVGQETSHKPVRRGMPTRVVGSFGISEPPAPISESFKEHEVGFDGVLSPGTLRKLKDDVAVSEPPKPSARPTPATMHQDPNEFEGQALAPPIAQASSASSMANVAPDPSVNLPIQGNQSLVIVTAIVAGAVSAAMAIFGLSYCKKHSASDDHHQETTEVRSAAAFGAENALPTSAVNTDAGQIALPVGIDPVGTAPALAEQEQAVGSSHRRARTSRTSTESAPSGVGQMAVPQTDPNRTPTPMEIMNQAREAARASDFDRCVTLARDAQRAGAPSAALRIEGDCLRRGGQNALALQAYQRFCRVAPDHPAISEVRALADSLGGTCP